MTRDELKRALDAFLDVADVATIGRPLPHAAVAVVRELLEEPPPRPMLGDLLTRTLKVLGTRARHAEALPAGFPP
jgi:hypothetical protein